MGSSINDVINLLFFLPSSHHTCLKQGLYIFGTKSLTPRQDRDDSLDTIFSSQILGWIVMFEY